MPELRRSGPGLKGGLGVARRGLKDGCGTHTEQNGLLMDSSVSGLLSLAGGALAAPLQRRLLARSALLNLMKRLIAARERTQAADQTPTGRFAFRLRPPASCQRLGGISSNFQDFTKSQKSCLHFQGAFPK